MVEQDIRPAGFDDLIDVVINVVCAIYDRYGRKYATDPKQGK